jgi:hypothetical protein
MKDRRILLTAILILIMAYIIKETGLIEVYENIATHVMSKVLPNLLEQPQAIVTLVVYTPLVFVGVVGAGVFRIWRDKKMKRKRWMEGHVES